MTTLQDFKLIINMSLFVHLTQKQRKKLLKECVEAAKGFELQCGREYGFGTPELPSRQTKELHKLQIEELKSVLTNNITLERLLATFSHHAEVSKFRNRNFSAKDIKDNTVLHQASQSTVLSITKTVQKLLSQRDTLWTLAQKPLENLLVLLGDNSCLITSLHAFVLDLPTNDDLSKFSGWCNQRHTKKFFS